MPLPLYFNEDVFDSLRLSQRTWRLDLAPHKTFELARAVEDPDVGEAAYRALVDEDIGDNLPVHAPPELLERDTRRVVGRQRVEVAFSEVLRSLICPRLPTARPTVLSTPVLRMARRSSVCLATSSRLSTQ
jgi:hypothetical protein